MATMELSDDDMELLIEALGRLREDKRGAFEASQRHPQLNFTERDFGIPKIDALTARIETLYNAS